MTKLFAVAPPACLTVRLACLVALFACLSLALPAGVRADRLELAARVARPLALETGQTLGLSTSYLRQGTGLTWGGRLAWAGLSENSMSWAVRQDELHLLALLGVSLRQGRTVLGAAIGLGGSLAYERRERHQLDRLGPVVSSGERADDLRGSGTRFAPRTGLDLSVCMDVWSPFSFSLHGGPDLWLGVGDTDPIRVGWNASAGVSWRLP